MADFAMRDDIGAREGAGPPYPPTPVIVSWPRNHPPAAFVLLPLAGGWYVAKTPCPRTVGGTPAGILGRFDFWGIPATIAGLKTSAGDSKYLPYTH
jgi:hypothetical protein